jgi:hypothetical protein
MFALSLRRADHVRRYSISRTEASGWEVRMEEDRVLRRVDRYRDWHRVELAQALVEREVSELTANGWQVAPTEH